MIRDAIARLFGRQSDSAPAMPEDEAQVWAHSPDIALRRRIASAEDARPDLLYYLARDASPLVRRAVAKNRLTPREADLILALDDVPEIRTLIAEKLSSQVDGLSRTDSTQLWQLTVAILEALAGDDINRVRRLVAEVARGVDRVPAHLATALGKDRDPDVALPALDYPGRIEDTDLVEIVEHAPDQRVVGAVAKRPAIGPDVSDAVVEHGDEPAITTLLNNQSARIEVTTLDRVVERAPPIDAWHEPLVHRPQLTENAAVRLAGFVAERLVQALQARPEFDDQTNAAITLLLRQRGDPPPAPPPPPQVAPKAQAKPRAPVQSTIAVDTLPPSNPLARARRHFAQGTLTEDLVLEALGNDPDFVIAAMALRTRLPAAVVNKILVSTSAKAMTALTWKAGFSMRLALQMQLRVARLPTKNRLNPGTGGNFPLTPSEMEWQLEFFRTLVPAGV